jgi:hypothetical protein
MSGFESLPGAENAAVATTELRAEEVAFAGDQWTDEAALKVVIQDVTIAENYRQSKRQPIQWENADVLYRGTVKSQAWPGTDVPMSNLSMPVVLEAVEKLMPAIFMAFFSDRQPFLLTPLGKTSPEAARAQEKLLMWAIKLSNFKEEIRLSLKSWLLYGFMAARWGWKTSTKTRKSYARTPGADGTPGRVSKTETPYEISHPTFEHLELRAVLFDPSLRQPDCRKGRWVAAQIFTTGYGLDELRKDPTYKNIPSRERLAQILSTRNEPTVDSLQSSKIQGNRDLQALPETQQSTADPLAQKLELLEYETEGRIITVLQRMITIRNEKNEFGKKTFLSSAFIDVPGSMYGFGVAKLLSGEQKFQVGVANAWINSLALIMNPAFHLKKGTGPGVQNIKVAPGKIINESGELTPLTVPSVTKEALEAINASEQRATRRVGANGGDNVPTQALRTAEGVNSFNQGIVDKLQYAIEMFADMVFIPALEAFLDVCKDNLQPDDIDNILSEEDGKAYKGDILGVYNGTVQVQVLSSTKLASRRTASQLAPLILQLVGQQPFHDSLTAQNKKFDYVEFVDQILDLTGWDSGALIVDATPAEVQQAMAMTMQKSAGAEQAKAQSAAQLQDQAHQNKLQEIEATGMERAGVLVVKHALAASDKPPVAIARTPGA